MKKLLLIPVVLWALFCAPALADVAITEVVSQNVTLRLDENGLAHDYVVLANAGGEAVELGGYALGDGKKKYEFAPARLMPGESMTIYLTGEEGGSPFKLSAQGETLYLYGNDGSLLQQLTVPAMGENQVFRNGRIEDGNGMENAGDLLVTEILAVNTLFPAEGGLFDMVELHNRGSEAIHLAGYGLSDKSGKPFKWRFSDEVIPAGGYLAVYLTEEVGFALSSGGECVLLSDPQGRPLCFVPFGPQENDVSLAWAENRWQKTWTPTPGAANVVTGKAAWEQSVYESNPVGLFISEVLASNGTFDDNGNSYDYVELYNGTRKRIKLADYYLSDDALNPQKWQFPKGATLSPGGYALIHMAGRAVTSSKPNTYYAGFKIGKTNTAVLLSNGEGIVDQVSLGRQMGDIAYGRVLGQGAFTFFREHTPRAANPAQGFLARTGEVALSLAGGLYESPVSVSLSAGENAVIRYTLDGAVPTEESPAYTGPLVIEKNTVLRARAFETGLLPSATASASYLFGVDVQVPVVALITDEKYLTSPSMGLFVKGSGATPNYQQKWEYPMHVQYFENGQMVLNQLASFRTTGGLGLTRPQKTISLYARGALGEDMFYFNPFPNRDYTAYNAFTLRSGGTESRGTRFKDELLTSLAQGLNVMYQDARPVVVYINGQYWGHYNLREKINQDSIAQWEGITDENITDNITILRSRGSIIHGDRKEINELIQFCKTKDLNVPENLQFVTDRLDVMSCFDHAILEIIAGNSDMHNVRYYKVPGGKWKLVLFDLDGSMDNLGSHPLNLFMTKATDKMDRFYHEPFAALMRVPEMKDLFLRRFGEILLQKCLAKDLAGKIDAWVNVIGPLMDDHVARWPDTSLQRWQTYVDLLRTNAARRPEAVVEHVAKAFKLTQEQKEMYFGAFLKANQQ